jgi:hypothetical protein
MPSPSAPRAQSSSSLEQALKKSTAGPSLLEALKRNDVAFVDMSKPDVAPTKPTAPKAPR